MFDSILVGTDGSATAGEAVRHAIDLASRLGARLALVSVYEPVGALRGGRLEPDDASEWSIRAREDAIGALEQARRAARAAGVEQVETFARQGDAADAILDVAEDQRCDLIVLGDRGLTGAKRFLLGSVPNKVSHHAPCSVLIVRTS